MTTRSTSRDMDTPITKRLIISGLTPAISADDISRRLTTFGTVKAADGFGLPDGLGQPRKFGYVTLETTTGKLAKCMNLLSGSTWKGAKLRFGEAKPDFVERIALENKQAAEEPPKKKRKRYAAVYADDMSLVTPENAAQRPGWKVSALGLITKPVKLRPARPLTDMQEETSRTKSKSLKKVDEGEKKKKKRTKDPDTRARRKAIDMTKWGSTHLKGMFLDLEVPESANKRIVEEDLPMDEEEEDSDSDNSGSGSDNDDKKGFLAVKPARGRSASAHPAENKTAASVAGPTLVSSRAAHIPPPKGTGQPPPASVSSTSINPPATPSQHLSSSLPENNTDVQIEKTQSLNLLASLFGTNDEDDWVGRESVGSDIDVDELAKGDIMLVGDDEVGGFEVVPKTGCKKTLKKATEDEAEEDSDEEEAEEKMAAATTSISQKENKEKLTTTTTLKDLFAPREEEAGFSLLGHLDLDIELDDEVPFLADQGLQATQQSSEALTHAYAPATTSITLQTHPSQAPLVLNPKQALFFPLPSKQEGSMNINKARQRDVYDIAKDNGWYWRDPAVGFYRTETEEEIKKRWEESKGELTREWKKRCREAGKVSRRKKGGVEGDNE